MSDVEDEALALRDIAHRMSQGIEIKTHKHVLRTFRNTFVGEDAVEWMIADSKSGVSDLDGAIEVGQRLIEHGYIARVSRELKAQQVRHFANAERTKNEFRGGDSLYRFDTLRISPFQLHVTVRRARNLKSMDFNGKNDPYVKLRLGTQAQETRVLMKTNNPVWEQRFVFGVSSVESQQLQLLVCDYDKFKQDDQIGTCKIGLSHLPCSEAVGGEDNEHHHEDAAEAAIHAPPHMIDHGDGTSSSSDGSREGRAETAAESVSSPSIARTVALSEDWGVGARGSRRHSRRGTGEDVASEMDAGSGDLSASKLGRSKRCTPPSVDDVFSWVKKVRSAPAGIGGGEPTDQDGDRETSGGEGESSVRSLSASSHAPHGQDEGLTYYRLLAPNEKRFLKEDAKLSSQADIDKSSYGELACDLRLTSFQPKPLAVQGEAKFSLRCRIWDMYGVTSSEERNIMAINSAVVKHKAVLMLGGDRVSSESFERSKEKERKTSFSGSLISLDTRANLATDMVKLVVQQRVSPVEMSYKPVATTLIPLRSIPVVFPGADDAGAPDPAATDDSESDKDGSVHDDEVQKKQRWSTSSSTQSCLASKLAALCGGSSGSESRRISSEREDGGGGGGQEGARSLAPCGGSFSDQGCEEQDRGGQHREQHATAKRYRLHTLAGPLTSRTMDNGFVIMSLELVASGNDLLGEPDELDSEDVKVPPPPPPDALKDKILDVQLNCGFQRLRKALLWNDSKLQAALNEMLNNTDLEQSPWVDMDGEAGAQDNLTGCKRERSFMIPKSAIVAATKAECHDIVLADGPSLVAFETRSRTPGVSFGDKFTVVLQYVLIKEGPEKCRLQTSSETVFNDKVMSLVQNQIVSAVTKVSRENNQHLLDLIEDALAGKGSGGGKGRAAKKQSSRGLLLCGCLVVLALLVAAYFLYASGERTVVGDKAEAARKLRELEAGEQA